MCLLTFLPAGVTPDVTALLTGALVNSDGHGFAIAAGDRMIVQRGLDGEHIVEAFATLRGQHLDGPALFHSRLATHGAPAVGNCHPFPVGGDQRTVIAHNGVLPAIVHPGRHDPRSDTRIAAEEFLPTFGSLRMARVRRRFERWLGPHNLLVVLSVDRRFRQRAYILNEPSGIWDDGRWYSNDSYQPGPLARGQSPDWLDWDRWACDDADPAAGWCPICGLVLGPAEDECPRCGWCRRCRQMIDNCRCYATTVLDRPDDRW